MAGWTFLKNWGLQSQLLGNKSVGVLVLERHCICFHPGSLRPIMKLAWTWDVGMMAHSASFLAQQPQRLWSPMLAVACMLDDFL